MNSESIADQIPKIYDPQSVEKRWGEFWIQEGLFAPSGDPSQPSFVMVIPPPNVTGSLHMGHALNNTLQDILLRWKKMQGFDALWVPGTDHGGIATQNVVEKLLKQEKQSRYSLGREKFLERMWEWRKESGDTILMQLKRLGCSLDWTRTRFTMDATCSQAVAKAFTDLYKKGWIYRGKRMVNWCVRCKTALSDIEVEYEERKDKLYYIRYPILSGARDGWQGVPLIIATTRPETMLGDTAVAVHPEDRRYEKITGWWVQLPLVEREISIIPDDAVDPGFGTGVVKVTPAHDPADFEMGERHHLSQEVVIDFNGKMTEAAGAYAGQSREECRKNILKDLEEKNLIEKIEDYTHSVGTCYRCGVIVEPLVSDQWFLKVQEMSQSAADATRQKKVQIFPDSWTKPYLHWLDNLKDWCISRQIWWGHRIPVWYCMKNDDQATNEDSVLHPALRTACPPIASEEKPAACPQCRHQELEQDPDVLDTWFSSALWPFSVFKWPKKSADLEKYYPTSVLVTGHEILYLWVARMVMFGLTFSPKESGKMEEKVPFRHVFIHGIVRDKSGKKMSKSLGNVVDPLGVMDQYGTDALRFVLSQQSVPGRDMQISNDTFVSARNFVNKIWNVTRFSLMNRTEGKESVTKSREEVIRTGSGLELSDWWIVSRFQKTIQEVNQSLEEYHIAQSCRVLYQFIWSEFCDWYIELSKIRIMDPAETSGKLAALSVRDYILEGFLRLLHPIMPFITEELWMSLKEIPQGDSKTVPSLLRSSYPRAHPEWIKEKEESEMNLIMDVIIQIRTIRSEMNVPPGKKISLVFGIPSEEIRKFMGKYAHYVRHLCKADKIEWFGRMEKPKGSASAVVNEIEIFVPLEGLVDFQKEKARLDKEVQSLTADLDRIEKRLSNPDFKQNAPEEQVSKALQRKNETTQKLDRLRKHIASFGS